MVHPHRLSIRPTAPLNFDFTETVEIIHEYPEIWVVYASDIWQQDSSDSASDEYNAQYRITYFDEEFGARRGEYPQRPDATMQVFGSWEDAVEFVERWKRHVMDRFIESEGPANTKHWQKYPSRKPGAVGGCPYILPAIEREAYIYQGISLEESYPPYKKWEEERANTDKKGNPLDEDGVTPQGEFVDWFHRPIVKEWAEEITTADQIAKWKKGLQYFIDSDKRAGRAPRDWDTLRPHPLVPELNMTGRIGVASLDDMEPEKPFIGVGTVYICERDADGNVRYHTPVDEIPWDCINMQWEVRVVKRRVRSL